jgi:flavin reductase (DIM6/NTAB) family NADH-FMN oxidoreductase RutF
MKIISTPGGLYASGRSAQAMFRRAAGFIPLGVAILSADGLAMTVSSLCCISWQPALISVSLAHDSRKASGLITSGRFHARLLRDEEAGLAKNPPVQINEVGLLNLECEIRSCYEAGDHHLVLAEVVSINLSEGFPLVYWRRGLHPLRPKYEFLASREAFEEFVRAWENCSLPAHVWSHAAHVAIGAYYAVQCPGNALERTRCGIVKYNEAVGKANTNNSGYHETLTRFWADIIRKIVTGFDDAWEAACCAVAKIGEDRDLHELYYSFDVVRDPAARQTWITPDMEGPY